MGAAYYGDLVRRRIAGAFVITESTFRAGSALPVHSHADPYFTFTLKGSYSERYGEYSRICTPGTAVAHPALEAHSQEFSDEPVVLIRIAPRDRDREPAVETALSNPLCVKNASIERALQHLHAELRHADASSDMIVEGLAYELAGYALRSGCANGVGSRRRALCVQTFIRSSLREPPSLGELAAELGVSRATLYRDFRFAFGCSPGDYLRRVRLDAAVRLLRKTASPLCEIAAECGFYDQSHLDRAFRAALGIAPSALRRSS